MKSKTYEDFIEKFKEKKTTDDCYTPEPVYHAIRNWVCSEYDIKSEKFVRPFFPGGDYENFNYSDDCVVVDNPPFSKLAKIMDFYVKHNILIMNILYKIFLHLLIFLQLNHTFYFFQ